MRRKIPKNKGVKYIAQTLAKYQKRKYGSYKTALPAARDILAKLNESGEQVSVQNIWKYSRTRRPRKKARKPLLPESLAQPSYYWDLLNYDAEIKRCSNELWFVSEVSPADLPIIQGGSSINAETYFGDYISYCNQLVAQIDKNKTRYTSDDCIWMVMCTEPEFFDGKWVSQIISVNQSAIRTDYGFDSHNPKSSPLEPAPPTSREEKNKKKQEATKAKDTTEESDRVKEIRGLISDLREDVKAGILKPADYSKKVDALLKKLQSGGNI